MLKTRAFLIRLFTPEYKQAQIACVPYTAFILLWSRTYCTIKCFSFIDTQRCWVMPMDKFRLMLVRTADVQWATAASQFTSKIVAAES